jgi:hypothetical protein
MKIKYQYLIPVYGLFIYPSRDKDKLLNDSGDDAFKLFWAFYHFMTTIPILVGLGFLLILLFDGQKI